MDGQSTRKKLKVDVSTSVEPEGVTGDKGRRNEDVLLGDPNKDYFTPEIMDVWPKILDYVTDAKDALSVMNASPELRELLKKRTASTLLPLVLPILIKQKPLALAPRDVFNCRLVSKQIKAIADDLIANVGDIRSRCIRYDSNSLMNAEVIQEFLDGTRGLTGNPFLGRCCSINLDGVWEGQFHDIMGIFRRFGHELVSANLIIDISISPRQALQTLKLVFGYLPKLERLELWFPHVIELQNYKMELLYFPPMEELRTLTISYRKQYGYYPYRVPPPGNFVVPILKAYGNQLTLLECESLVFRGELRGPLHFYNLLELEVPFILNEAGTSLDGDELSQIFRKMAKFSCPKLEKLLLTGAGMRMTVETFLALNQFRRSLKVLRIDNLDGDLQIFQVDPSTIRKFPTLRRLTLCTVDVGTEWIHVFRVMFPNLEEIWFLSPEANPDLRSRIAVQPPIPDETLGRSYYSSFPKLNAIVWYQHSVSGGTEISSWYIVRKSGVILHKSSTTTTSTM
ncbi:hypothetical protein Ocin01_11379 [Orchesella cincta]|uniref:F-box domain-containing protein n=1 Tax=Orchesella cincta TaxID=48709 RepID=A0A1D2MRF0_ORCCI|nr:hypothetical protein Ocin01_11379 [Orchesella cincta]